jgi:hypothetical protein
MCSFILKAGLERHRRMMRTTADICGFSDISARWKAAVRNGFY